VKHHILQVVIKPRHVRGVCADVIRIQTQNDFCFFPSVTIAPLHHLVNLKVFSECELTFTFATCYRPSVCRRSVCNARAPYSASWNFQECFFIIWYHGHPLTSTKNFMEII